MSNEYRIESLMDVFKDVPKDRIKLCMEELSDALIHAREFQEMHNSLSNIEHCVFPGYVTWIDDDKGTYDLNITNNGEKFADIHIKTKPEQTK